MSVPVKGTGRGCVPAAPSGPPPLVNVPVTVPGSPAVAALVADAEPGWPAAPVVAHAARVNASATTRIQLVSLIRWPPPAARSAVGWGGPRAGSSNVADFGIQSATERLP